MQRAPPLVRMWYRLGWGGLAFSFRLPRWMTNLLLKCDRNLGFSCCWVMRTTWARWVSAGARGPQHNPKLQVCEWLLAPLCHHLHFNCHPLPSVQGEIKDRGAARPSRMTPYSSSRCGQGDPWGWEVPGLA